MTPRKDAHDRDSGQSQRGQTGFVPQAKRWVVERAYGILMLHRRLVRDYEHLPRSSQSRVYWAMTAVILRRLTVATVPAWRTA
ncbi:transposase [Streptomyces canus]